MEIQPKTHSLRILATSDLHMQLSGYNYMHSRSGESGGLAGLASLITRMRKQTALRDGLALLVDNGDTIQGNALADMAALRPELPHPMAMAMNRLGYDAIGLGNHDLDFGLECLDRFIGACAMPVISSNLISDHLPGLAVSALLRREIAGHDITIGVLSTLPVQTANWNRHHLEGRASFDAPLAAASQVAATLRANGADIVVALVHSGIARLDGQDLAENQIQEFAGLMGIDAIIAGHSHKRFPDPDFTNHPGVDIAQGTIHGRPVAQPAAYGGDLAVIDMHLQRTATGWLVHKARARLTQPTQLARDNDDILRICAPLHNITRGYLAQNLARPVPPMNSFFTPLRPSKVEYLLADVRRKTVQEAIKGSKLEQLPLLIATCDYTQSGPDHYIDIRDHSFQRRHATGITPFADQIWALRVNGAQILCWLEWATRLYNPPQTDGPLIRADIPLHNFDTLHGLRYDIDPFSTPQIRNLSWQGRAVRPDQEFLVATTHYRASGGGGIALFDETNIALRTDVLLDGALTTYLKRGDFAGLEAPPTWRLAPSGTAQVWFDTPPASLDCLHEIAPLNPKYIGTTKHGMARLLLHLAPTATAPYINSREVGAGERLANPVRSGRKQP